MDEQIKEVDVAIVGYGPVGVTAANLLGLYGVSTAVFEKEQDIFNVPRASACDDEVMRIFQTAGLSAEMLEHMTHPPGVRWVAENGSILAELPFHDTDLHFGYPTQLFFWQPLLEKSLRDGVSRYSNVEIKLGHEVETLEQTDDNSADGRITLGVRDKSSGELTHVRARYVLGCDGGRSTTRHLVGVHESGKTNEHPWLVVDIAVKEPLKDLSYMQLYCNPSRPAVSYPMPMDHHRWEFMVMPGETAEQMEQEEKVRQLISTYMDPSEVEIVRKAVYNFHERVSDRWRVGRLFLLGDAAHMMPPFLGQGMSAGVRDAANLTWKLAMVLRGTADDSILDSYEMERRPHAEAMMQASVRNGSIIQTIRPQVAHLRDLVIITLTRLPQVQGFLSEADPRAAPVYKTGLMADGHSQGRHAAEGHLFIQPKVQTAGGETVLLDDALGTGFAIMSFADDPRAHMSARSGTFWQSLPARVVRVVPAGSTPTPQESGDRVVIADVEGKLAAWFQEHGAGVVVLRPDRYVFGVFAEENGTAAAEQALRAAQLGP
jgi:3-(3-hydroxy-phenyl)propionate hydroxylase